MQKLLICQRKRFSALPNKKFSAFLMYFTVTFFNKIPQFYQIGTVLFHNSPSSLVINIWSKNFKSIFIVAINILYKVENVYISCHTKIQWTNLEHENRTTKHPNSTNKWLIQWISKVLQVALKFWIDTFSCIIQVPCQP